MLKRERENRRPNSDIKRDRGQIHHHAHERHPGLPRLLLRGGISFCPGERRIERTWMFIKTRRAAIARYQRRDLSEESSAASNPRSGCGGGNPDEHGGPNGDAMRERAVADRARGRTHQFLILENCRLWHHFGQRHGVHDPKQNRRLLGREHE